MRIWIAALWFATGLMAADATYDGSRVHYESYGKGQEAVVFIHGWTCDLTFWRGQAPVYEKRRALLVDLPGHGQSDKPEVAYTQERFARAIDAVMRDAKVDRAVLVGHSMGGPVALTFLRLFPAKTKALVMVDAYVPQAPKDDAERARQGADGTVSSFIQRAELQRDGGENDRGNVLREDDAGATRGDPHKDGSDTAAGAGFGHARHVCAGSAEGRGDLRFASDGHCGAHQRPAGVRSAPAYGISESSQI